MYQQNHTRTPISGIRLTDADVHDIIGVWIERQNIPQEASVADVAEGLDISTEEVDELLQYVRSRRATVQSGIAQEQARLTQEQRLLAEEQARLWREENCLAEYHVRRANIYQKRMEVQVKWTTKKSRIARSSQKSAKQNQHASVVLQPPPLKQPHFPHRELSVFNVVVKQFTVILLIGGVGSLAYQFVATMMH